MRDYTNAMAVHCAPFNTSTDAINAYGASWYSNMHAHIQLFDTTTVACSATTLPAVGHQGIAIEGDLIDAESNYISAKPTRSFAILTSAMLEYNHLVSFGYLFYCRMHRRQVDIWMA